MKKINKYLFVMAIAATGLLQGCEDLDVPNENNPDFDQVLATPADVETVAASIYNTVFSGEHRSNGVEAMLATAADHVTCSWGNFGMRDMSWEPRDMAWNNSPAYSNQGQLKYSYDQWYSAIGSATDVLTAIDINGMVVEVGGVDQTVRARAFAKFGLGLAYGNLALVFDKAHVVDEKTTVEPVIETALPYEEVATVAIGYLEEALALSDASFEIPGSWMGSSTALSSSDFKKIISTSIARIMAYLPRNSAELDAVDWQRVMTLADNGLASDWIVEMDGTSRWYFEAGDYLTYPGWGRTDMYVAHLMEPSLPQHWEDDPTFPHPAQPTDPMDHRLETDFQYMASNDFLAARGYYHYSAFRFKRYDDIYTTTIGPKATVMLEENNLLRAEARAYTGDLSGAAAIINAGTRVSRGGLAPVSADLDEVIDAIHHERHVELYTTGFGIQFFEMRKRDLLQEGTPLHLPIPGRTLELFGVSNFYTFGTTANADGIGTSNGGWR